MAKHCQIIGTALLCCSMWYAAAMALDQSASAALDQRSNGGRNTRALLSAKQQFDVQFEGECRADSLYHCSHILTAAQRAASFRTQSEELVKALGSALQDAKVQAATEPQGTPPVGNKAPVSTKAVSKAPPKAAEEQPVAEAAVVAQAEEEDDAKEFEKEERQTMLLKAREAQVAATVGTDLNATSEVAQAAALGKAKKKLQRDQERANQQRLTELQAKLSLGNAGAPANSTDDTAGQPTGALAAQAEEEEDAKELEAVERQAALLASRDAQVTANPITTSDSTVGTPTASASAGKTAKTRKEKAGMGKRSPPATSTDADATAGQPAGAVAAQAEEEEDAKELEAVERQAALLAARDAQVTAKPVSSSTDSTLQDMLAVAEANQRATAKQAKAEELLQQVKQTQAEQLLQQVKQRQQQAELHEAADTGSADAPANSTDAEPNGAVAAAAEEEEDAKELEAAERQAALRAATDTQGEGKASAPAELQGASRRLTAFGTGSGGSSSLLQQRDFHKHEATELISQQQPVSEILGQFGLDPGMPVAALLGATAPLARCLRQAIRDSELSISPTTAQVSMGCQEDVRGFFIDRAADVKLDPPLIAACAGDMLKMCRNVSSAGGQLFHCLKAVKADLSPLCRTAVIARQVDASEDMALDAVLSAACSADRQRLCSDAGWGEAAAQTCLEQVLHAEMLSGMRGLDPEQQEREDERIIGKGGSQGQLGLSPACATALFHRQVEESEDIRFNYRLSHACAGDKHMFCRDVRPGAGDVVGCLEQHAHLPSFSDECRSTLEYQSQLRATDVRLDARFRDVCSKDVHALCLDVESKILDSADEPPGAGARIMECMRRVREDIRSSACAAHVRGVMRGAYLDNRLDVLLMDRCDEDATKLCIDKSSTLECLRAKLIMHEPLQPECAEMVRERARQAAADLSFMPQLEQACVQEVATLCSGPHLKGAEVLDCLADNRRDESFGEVCRDALVAHLSDAVSDVRMLHTLREDCKQDITQLCGTTAPGEGRVLACLQQNRANITQHACKKQMLRMLGLAVDDYRLDYSLSQACKADVQQLCAGVDTDDTGAVHQCLRHSMDHLSEDCKAAQETLETMEHEDVRLNPRIQRECPLAISMFCAGEVAPGSANVITCLQQAASKPAFPEGCRTVMHSLMERSSLKYSLNFKLKDACDEDVASMCPDASDEPTSAADPGILGCLAANSSALSKGCRSEMAALVRLHLNSYHMGMPLTSVCDGDVMARCNVEKQVAPFLMGGYILSCLSKSFSQLHTPCWSLISMFDEGQYQSATTLENKPWSTELQKETMDTMKRQVVAEVRGDLESKMLHNLETKVEVAVEEKHSRMKPLVHALLNATSFLMAIVAVLALIAWFLWTKYIRRATDGSPRTRTVAIKDGRV